MIASSEAFKVRASFDSAYLAGLFESSVGRVYNVKMVSFDPNSLTAQNKVEELLTVTFAYACNQD